jgi:transcriptional regulator with XRE-family HTH domain
MKLGDKILELRKKKGLSQEQLGEKLDVTRQTISNWELNETQPNPEQLKQLSKELNISIDELLDNDVKSVVVEKVSNTEKLAGLIYKLLKGLLIFVVAFFALTAILAFLFVGIRKSKSDSRTITESIHCHLYGEEHGLTIKYEETSGIPIEIGSDSYFIDILDLGKYDNAHQIFNVINDYVKKNGGTCTMLDGDNINDGVEMTIKKGTLSKTKATILIKNTLEYEITTGEPFYIEKYNINKWEKVEDICNGSCIFNLPAYNIKPFETREITHNWEKIYGELPKGTYRLVKEIFFDSDRPITEEDIYKVWVEFEIE